MKMNVDSDSDEASDVDVPVQASNVLTRSVFNITFDLARDDETQESRVNNERIEYEKRLNDEIEEWHSLMKKVRQKFKDAPSINNSDYSLLSQEKLSYLMKAPDLNKFLTESIEFQKEAKVYLEVDYADILELHENLAEICKDKLDTKKSKLIEDFIFNEFKKT